MMFARGNPEEIRKLREYAEKLDGVVVELYSETAERYHDSKIDIDFVKYQVSSVRGTDIPLSPIEFRLLTTLALSPYTVENNELMDRVWGEEEAASPDNLRTYIKRLRYMIEENPGDPTLIETIHGFGYRYNRPSQLVQTQTYDSPQDKTQYSS